MTSSSSSKTEFTCFFYDVLDVGGYAGSSRLEVSLLYLLAYLPSLFLLVAVLMLLVVLFPTSLSLLNSELICRSYGSSGFLECGFFRVPAVVPWYPAVVPLRSHKRQYRSAAVVPAVPPQQYYRWHTRSLPCRFEGSFSVSDCVVPRCGRSAAVPLLSGSTALPPR